MVEVCFGALSQVARTFFVLRFSAVRCTDVRCDACESSGGDGNRGRALTPVHCGGRGEVLEGFGNGISFINLLSFVTLI